MIRAAVDARTANGARYEALLGTLTARAVEVVPVLRLMLLHALAVLWERGWTPAAVSRVVSKHLSPVHGRVATRLALADAQAHIRRGQSLHPRWQAELDALLDRAGPPGGTLHDGAHIHAGIDLLWLFGRLDSIPQTVPAPGASAGSTELPRGLDERILARVRALLAKAESTEFTEEAEALTAKAQELIARYAVDEALLTGAGDVGEPSVRHIPVDDPYADAKASVVSEVASANHCRAVYCVAYGWVTVFGYERELDAVALLAASLLAQATGVMVRVGPLRDASGRSRTRSFRRSFLLGFGHRVGERLREATAAQVASADSDRLLPVLSRRDERLDEAVASAFRAVRRRAGTVGHAYGFAAGQAAADLASLDASAGSLSPRDGHAGPRGRRQGRPDPAWRPDEPA